ncbi:MAG: serine protease [Sphingobacteriia bacterium]|nr:serine protease [Sphingobacteriia bacterium]NCC40654.1 serine protease [Gammaproteobacteria bacterium]
MQLTGHQIRSYVNALKAAFMPERFDELLLGRLDRYRHDISMKANFESILFDVVDAANRYGWALQLLDAARASNPDNPQLLAFEESLGLGVIPVANKVSLEQIVNDRSSFQNVLDFRTRLGLLESWLCAFEIPKSGGTGLLVGPDLVLTNYHVIEGILNGKVSPANVRCRFDYKALSGGETVNAGTPTKLADDWDVVHAGYSKADTDPNNQAWGADELDFAIVRLNREIGKEPIGDKAEPGAPARGWLALPAQPDALAQNDILFILQHPQDLEALGVKLQPMQLAIGAVQSFAGNGLRMRHDTRTLPGSSGSPVFNADLEITALHHAGEPNNRLDYHGAYNQAIPLGEITRYLREKGHGALLAG